MTKLEKFDPQTLETNPFIYGLQIPVTKVISNIEFEHDTEDGLVYNKSFYIERTKKTIMYHCESCKINTIGLSDKALRLYTWVYMTVESGKDYIQLNADYYMKKSGVKSINTYKDAVKELIRYSYIQPTQYKTVFWINPNIFFNGNRLKKYPNNIVEVNVWEK